MPRFEPFAALRFAPSLPLGEVTAPPYDVLSAADTAALAARHQHNIVAIDVPRPDDDPDRYDRSAAVLAAWLADGTLVLDSRPSFTLYRMAFTTEAGTRRETVGVLGALEVVDLGAGGVLPHERTTPKATTDRIVQAITAMPATNDATRLERVRSAAYLIVSSPAGAIQK